MLVTVRQAKAELSRLLDEAAAGEEIIITCDGRPKARLLGLPAARTPLKVNWSLLRVRPKAGGKTRLSEDLVREDRDARD